MVVWTCEYLEDPLSIVLGDSVLVELSGQSVM